MFIDEAQIYVKAGNGGNGRVSFRKKPERGPDGGNGGKGGDICVEVISDINGLRPYAGKKNHFAENGFAGLTNNKTGRNGQDLNLKMPIGTELADSAIGFKLELKKIGEKIIICRGGRGGRGNFEFRSSKNTTPRFAETGKQGEEKNLCLTLRLIAHFGLIGLPNAGKSSLLNELTAAKAKIADYPFTTLEPNLGVLQGKVMADIPGLIAGASKGRGLGIKFLKHIEKVSLLIHCIDASSPDILNDYQIVRNELETFNPKLIKKREIIVLTKKDLVDKNILAQKIKNLKKLKKQVLAVSILDEKSLKQLAIYLKK